MSPSEIETAVAAFDHALSQDISRDAAWRALQTFTEKVIGAKLFTIMTVDMENEVARRAYTSDPVAYPSSGTKPIHYDSWFDIVHKDRRSFIANTIAEIATVFPDHETIWSLGCGSVINFPIILDDVLVATVNMLHEESFYTAERVEMTKYLSLPAKAAFLAEKLSQSQKLAS
jgi:hypothetical protein